MAFELLDEVQLQPRQEVCVLAQNSLQDVPNLLFHVHLLISVTNHSEVFQRLIFTWWAFSLRWIVNVEAYPSFCNRSFSLAFDLDERLLQHVKSFLGFEVGDMTPIDFVPDCLQFRETLLHKYLAFRVRDANLDLRYREALSFLLGREVLAVAVIRHD